MNRLFLIVFGLVLAASSCKSRRNQSSISGRKALNENTVIHPGIKSVHNRAFNFDYLSYKIKCSYKDPNMSQSFNMNVRMRFDSLIWISITSVGFEAVRVKMTKDSIIVMSRLERQYYLYDYNYIKKLIGTDLSLTQIQSMLTAYPVFDLQKYTPAEEDLDFSYRDEYVSGNLKVDKHDHLTEQFFKHLIEESSARIEYSNYKKIDDQKFPGKLDVHILNNSKEITLKMENSTISTGKIEAYPFNIPDKYAKGN
ncbi:MAG: DUF4292 domain-containing protein [Flavobacteriales bacterium]|nr:DUF4292 domain-containing protein [Flavobacteriales bacterium]